MRYLHGTGITKGRRPDCRKFENANASPTDRIIRLEMH